MEMLKDIFNDFEISVDWLEFTLKIKNIVSACSLVGLDFTDFNIKDNGALGYSKYGKHKSCSIAIFWQGNDDMGCHFRVTGSSIFVFFQNFIVSRSESTPFGTIAVSVDDFTRTYFPLLFKTIRDNGKITRLDLALDDYSGEYYSTESILECLNNNMIISKFKNYESIIKRKISDSELKGHTIYFGSRVSDIFLRVYDKRLERDSELDFWNRWELELKGDKANDVIDIIIKKDCCGVLFFEILNEYLRFINLDRTERKNCTTQKLWLDFLGNVSKCNLSIHKTIKTIENKIEWVNRQCMPTVAGIIKYFDGDMGFIYNQLEGAYIRNNLDNKMLFQKEVDYVIQ